MGRNRKRNAFNTLAIFSNSDVECRNSSVYGRHLVAKRRFKAGELVLKERCTVAGPCRNEKEICIGCHSRLGQIRTRCTICSWYICKEACSEKSPFHTVTECHFLSKNNIKPPTGSTVDSFDYGIITIIRVLLLKIEDPETWNEVMSLQSHNEHRSKLPIWKMDKELVRIIQKEWNLGTTFSSDEIFKICGILDVNGFEMGDGWSFTGLYLKSSMISHSCVPNAAQNENIDEKCLEIMALTDITPETPIFICYDGLLEGTRYRQRKLFKSKYFNCKCTRCEDPTELGTNFSSLNCLLCKKGHLNQAKMEDDTANWICTNSKCTAAMSVAEIDGICNDFMKKCAVAEKCIEDMEAFLKSCENFFHPNHFIPFKVKLALCSAYGHENGYSLESLSPSQISRKMDLCTSILKVLDSISPGFSVGRGNVLYELQAAQALILKGIFSSERCSRGKLRKKLSNTIDILNEAISIFNVHYPLRLLAKSAKELTLNELVNWEDLL